MKKSKPEYLEKALLLPAEEQERLLSRMAGKLPRRLESDKLSVEEALAIQLELEDEQLNEWREKMRAINEKAQKKALARQKVEEESAIKPKAEKPGKKTAASAKFSTPGKPKPPATSED